MKMKPTCAGQMGRDLFVGSLPVSYTPHPQEPFISFLYEMEFFTQEEGRKRCFAHVVHLADVGILVSFFGKIKVSFYACIHRYLSLFPKASLLCQNPSSKESLGFLEYLENLTCSPLPLAKAESIFSVTHYLQGRVLSSEGEDFALLLRAQEGTLLFLYQKVQSERECRGVLDAVDRRIPLLIDRWLVTQAPYKFFLSFLLERESLVEKENSRYAEIYLS